MQSHRFTVSVVMSEPGPLDLAHPMYRRSGTDTMFCYYGTDKTYSTPVVIGISANAFGAHILNGDSDTSIVVTCSIAPCTAPQPCTGPYFCLITNSSMLSLTRQHFTCTSSQNRCLHSSTPTHVCSRHTVAHRHKSSHSRGRGLQSGVYTAQIL